MRRESKKTVYKWPWSRGGNPFPLQGNIFCKEFFEWGGLMCSNTESGASWDKSYVKICKRYIHRIVLDWNPQESKRVGTEDLTHQGA